MLLLESILENMANADIKCYHRFALFNVHGVEKTMKIKKMLKSVIDRH